LGGVRFTSSASTTCAKIGPRTKRNTRRPVARSSSSTSVPVMSAGIRSGVNWMRPNDSASASASVWISSVFRQPGDADEQAVPAGEQRHQQVVDDAFLADDPLADLAQQHRRVFATSRTASRVAHRVDERHRRRPGSSTSIRRTALR
jgi:hypothetical protein